MFELTVEMGFSAAHCLPQHPGRSARLHGHSYRALVTVAGDRLDAQGMVVDFGDLKAVSHPPRSPLDHIYLNELPTFAATSPTAEAIAQHLYREPCRAARGRDWRGSRSMSRLPPSPPIGSSRCRRSSY